MRADDEPDVPWTPPDPGLSTSELAETAPILAAKLARLPPEQLAMIFPPENSVGPV
ncbi:MULTISPECIES: hypothetical protein [Micrococcaceae]|uniref:hypothetical protein n=1 Tax=Micrococcaceae TaxID=1268 RepID=UPI0012FE2505|nr:MULTISPECIES: hypothetical protein [Micrococcaceae]WGM22375.1 hypothetical protein QEH68_09475 [Paenarthrobacter sp. OM7]